METLQRSHKIVSLLICSSGHSQPVVWKSETLSETWRRKHFAVPLNKLTATTRVYPPLPRFSERHYFLAGSQDSHTCPSRKSRVQTQTVTKHWCKDNDGGKPKYSEKYVSQCQFVCYKSDMHWRGTESGPSWWKASDWSPKPTDGIKRLKLT